MFSHPTKEPQGLTPIKDRRAAPGAAKGPVGLLRKLRGVLARPLRLQRQDGRLRLVLVERRRSRAADAPPSLPDSRDELRARLLLHGNEQAAHVMRHLVRVHDALGRGGWPAVESLPAQVLGMALVQAEMLASDEPTQALAMIIEHLRLAKVAAELREEHASRPPGGPVAQALEVSEVPRDKFDEWAREDWVDTSPPSDVYPGRTPGERRT